MSLLLSVSLFLFFFGFIVETILNQLTLRKFKRRISFTSLKAILILFLPLVDRLLLKINFLGSEIGLVLVFLGVALRIWTHMEWYRHLVNSPDTLLISGPYRFAAHPMWTGLLVSVLGIYILAGSYFGLVSFFIFWCPLAFKQLKMEEAELMKKYGELYMAYLNSVAFKILRS